METVPAQRYRCPRALTAALVLAAIFATLPAWAPNGLGQQRAGAVRATLPAGFTLYSSRVLPYSIGYPPGWQAGGSISGSSRRLPGTYFDGDVFSKRMVGDIDVSAERLPSGSGLTSADYADIVLLDLQRAEEAYATNAYTARSLGTTEAGGQPAYVLEVQTGRGDDALYRTEAVFVAAQRGWRIVLTAVTGAAREAALPEFLQMAGTFRLH